MSIKTRIDKLEGGKLGKLDIAAIIRDVRARMQRGEYEMPEWRNTPKTIVERSREIQRKLKEEK